MRRRHHEFAAFTLVELLCIVVIIGILAALLFPVSTPQRSQAKRSVCMSNLRQINLAIHMYLDDQIRGSPGNTNAAQSPFVSWTDYRQLINNYVGLKGASPHDIVFACPSDAFFYDRSSGGRGYVPTPLHEQADQSFTSYAYNAGQFSTRAQTNKPATTNYYGIAGMRLDSVLHPGKTVLTAETPAYFPYSWHEPVRPFSSANSQFNDSKNTVGFVDGHVAYTKMYYNGEKIAWDYNPPAGYSYQWSGD
jgi:prepilin-type processing-associated H-X9-DG protein